MKKEYTRICGVGWGDEIFFHLNGPIIEENMIPCTFEHSYDILTTARLIENDKQFVARTNNFYMIVPEIIVEDTYTAEELWASYYAL